LRNRFSGCYFPRLAEIDMDPATRTALIVCFVIFGALALWIVLSWRRTRYTFGQFCLYVVNSFFTRVLWRTQVSGPLPVSADEGAVIVSNHQSGIDPLLIQLCTDRVVHWMVAREYYNMPGISFVFRTLRSIPVNRGGVDTASTKMAIRLAQQGGLVGLFPEGRVNMTDALLLPGRSGAALIALRARVKVIPCFVSGSPYDGTALGSFFMSANARVKVGQPIDLSAYYGQEGDKAVLQELTRQFLVEIARLAGAVDFEPTLAGRNWKSDDELEVEAATARATNGSPGD
jgi:1-acyl-sn-glycerol-3-phosphate acyltransferase